MTEEESPDIDVLKIKLGDDIPVEEEPVFSKENQEKTDLVDELSKLGRQLGETMSAAWKSEERQRFEREVKEGVKSFTREIDKAFHEVRETNAAQKMKEEASEFKSKVKDADLSQKTQSSIAQGLKWMSVELGNLADQFTGSEKQPEDFTPDDNDSGE